MLNNHAKASHDHPFLGNLTIVRYLLSANSPEELQMTSSHTPSDYIPYLSSAKAWNEFQSGIHDRIMQLQTEIEDLHEKTKSYMRSNRLDDPAILQDQLENEVFTKYQELHQLFLQEKTIAEINTFIHDSWLQELLLTKNELTKWHSSYTKLCKELDEKRKQKNEMTAQRNAAYGNDELEKYNTLKIKILELATEEDEIQIAIQKNIHEDRSLQELLATIAFLEKQPSAASHHQHEDIEKATTVAESSAEMAATVREIIADKQEYMAGLEQETGNTSENPVTSQVIFARSIPLVNHFVRGLVYLHESYEAYKNPVTPQRKTKITAGLFGGLVSIGVGIVGALLLAGTGLMATGAAIYLTPIILAAAVSGVYAITLYRDAYILHQVRQKIEKTEKELKKIKNEITSTNEIIISNFIHSLTPEEKNNTLKTLQNTIDEKRSELHAEYQSPRPDNAKINFLKNEIVPLCHQRNEIIKNTPEIHKSIIEQFQNDPRMARISMQKSNLINSLNRLQQIKNEARKKTGFSIASFIGVGLAVVSVALALTGVGALIVGAVAATALVGVSAGRVYNAIVHKKTIAAKQQEIINPIVYEQTHSSELLIEKELFQNQQENIAHALIHQISSANDTPKKKYQTVSANQTVVTNSHNEKNEKKREKKSGSIPKTHL